MTNHSCNLLEISRTQEEIRIAIKCKEQQKKDMKRENYGDGREKQTLTLLANLGKGRIEQVR